MRYLVLLLQFLLICGTFAVNPKSDQSSDVLSNYLKKIHKDYEITGYNLHNLLKKDSPIENQAKIKINKLFGINLKLLETLDQIIKDEQYPSLFLSQNQSNDIQETQQQNPLNEEDNNEETEEQDENDDNTAENNEQQQNPQNEEDNNEETEEQDENDDNTAENNEQQQYPLNAENNKEESGEEEEEEEEEKEEEEEEEEKEEEEKEEEEEEEEVEEEEKEEEEEEEEEEKEEEEEEEEVEEEDDDDKNDSKNDDQLIEEEFSPEDDEISDDQQPYPDWNENYNQRINQNNGNPIPQEYAQFSPENDEDSDDQRPYPAWNGYYNNQNGMGFPIDPANNELIFEYRNNQNSIDKNNFAHNLRRIQKAKNSIFGSFDDADFQDNDDEDVNENQYPYENDNQLNQPYNNQNYGNNIDTIQLQSDSMQPENPYDMSQYNDQQYPYMNNNYPNTNQMQLESDAIGQYQDMNNNYPNTNQMQFESDSIGQYQNRTPNVRRNNRKSQRTDTRNQQNLSPLQIESDSFDNPNDNVQQDDYPEANNNRQQTQTQLQNNSFNQSVSNYPQSYDPKINNYGPNTPNRQQVVNNRQNMDTNNTGYFSGNKSIQGNQQAWIQNQKESYRTPNTNVNSAQNYPYNRGMPINQGLSPIMQNPSNNIPNNVMSQSFNGTPVSTQTSNSTLNKYIIYQPKPKKPVITDPKKRPKLHDLRNFLNEPTVEVVKSPAQEEEDSRHSYLYSTGDDMDYDIFSDELHANHF